MNEAEAEAAEERAAIQAEDDERERVDSPGPLEQLAIHANKTDIDGLDVVEGDQDDFAVPTIEAAKQDHAGEGEPFRTIPAQAIRNEMSMAFLDARLIVHNTFDHIPEDESTSGPPGRLQKDLTFHEYVELVSKVAITLSIARFTSMGIRQ